ncbi:MAG TPA: DNA mismatch repair protein MutS, partial [Saprospiraceae bacterium]|nr:DNA mismatch repair protein MutS [Saprospiraceae bacterium]
INEYIESIQANCAQIARLDCLISFAYQAGRYHYNKPEFNDDGIIRIIQGRHPIIEVMLGHEKKYIPNDLYLDQESQQIIILTGPNMAGKSAVLRQTGLISLMAQIGSFVPAESASLSIVDKLFTRVGASDNISGGESTFMVEMNETASIMNNLTDRSLILLDEIGRGTATYDGISIAWALAEYLHDNDAGRPKTLFATHYHELNELTYKLPRVKNYNLSVKETKDKVIFLYKLAEGGSEHSFGIHVARMAGMPQRIIDRSNQIMKHLEDQSGSLSGSKKKETKEILQTLKAESYQLSIFETDDPNIGEIRNILLDIQPEIMTPIDCLIKLKELQELAQKSLLERL